MLKKGRFRRMKFALRDLLLVLAAVALPIAAISQYYHWIMGQRRALHAIGTTCFVTRTKCGLFEDVVCIDAGMQLTLPVDGRGLTPIRDRVASDLSQLRQFPRLEMLGLHGRRIRPRDVSVIETLDQLRVLHIHGTDLVAAEIEGLLDLPSLRELFIDESVLCDSVTNRIIHSGLETLAIDISMLEERRKREGARTVLRRAMELNSLLEKVRNEKDSLQVLFLINETVVSDPTEYDPVSQSEFENAASRAIDDGQWLPFP